MDEGCELNEAKARWGGISLSPTTSLLLVHQCFNPSLPSNLPAKRGGLPKRNAEELGMTQSSLSKRWASISDHKTLPPLFSLKKN